MSPTPLPCPRLSRDIPDGVAKTGPAGADGIEGVPADPPCRRRPPRCRLTPDPALTRKSAEDLGCGRRMTSSAPWRTKARPRRDLPDRRQARRAGHAVVRHRGDARSALAATDALAVLGLDREGVSPAGSTCPATSRRPRARPGRTRSRPSGGRLTQRPLSNRVFPGYEDILALLLRRPEPARRPALARPIHRTTRSGGRAPIKAGRRRSPRHGNGPPPPRI